MTYTTDQIKSLIEHLKAGHALCRHDIGHRLPDILAQLMANQKKRVKK